MAGGWRNLSNHLAELSVIPSRIATNVAHAITLAFARQFRQGADPYGNPWRALSPTTVRKKGHDLIMIDTGKMQQETRAVPMPGAGIALITVPYAAYHQGPGPYGRPARPVLPNKRELPEAWQAAVAREWKIAFKRTMKG